MSDEHCFISYSNGDADDLGPQLSNDLEAGNPYIDTWFDKRDIPAGSTWDEKVPEAIKTCKCFLFIMTNDSIAEKSICAQEWDLALKYKIPIFILRFQKDITEAPFRLGKRQWIDFSNNYKSGLAKLRQAIKRLDSTDGQLDVLKDRLADANRDLPRTDNETDKARIKIEINQLNEEIKANELIKKDPEKAKKQTRKNINAGLEQDRQPINIAIGKPSSKFINPRPGSIPDYFEGRLVETEEIVNFLRNDYQRIMTIVGRAGSGKTVLACRLLQNIENGRLPNGLGEFISGGIVYLSEISNHKINVANIFSGLLQLVETKNGSKVEKLYREAKVSIHEKIRALLKALPKETIILLLDNFEDLLDFDQNIIVDQELHSALVTILQEEPHSLKIIITTRMLPRQFNMIDTSKQNIKHLDEGLPSPFAENVLRKMDKDGHAGLRDATDELLYRIREVTLGYPRALEALYGILRVDRYSSVDDLLVEGLPETVVEKFVGEAFSRLNPIHQKIMQALAIYNRPVSSAAVDFVLQFHLPGINSAPILEQLVSMHFARREAKRYFLHPADRDYALSRMPLGNTNKKLGQGARGRTWDRYALTLRAADYFAEIRKPRTEWKKLDDLSAQLAEFDLRYIAGDYASASNILREIDNLMQQWGHYRLTIQLNEMILDKINNEDSLMFSLNEIGWAYLTLGEIRKAIIIFERGFDIAHNQKIRGWESAFLGNLGNAYSDLGELHKSIEFCEKSLVLARLIGDKRSEGSTLGNLGNAYSVLGKLDKGIDFYEQDLEIAREINDRSSEGTSLVNLGLCYGNLGNLEKELEYYSQSLAIANEINDRSTEIVIILNLAAAKIYNGEFSIGIDLAKKGLLSAIELGIPLGYQYTILSLGYFLDGQLEDAFVNGKEAQNFDLPRINHFATLLLGMITLQIEKKGKPNDAFNKSIIEANAILSKTPDYFEALNTKGLALCGLAICEDKKYITEAIESFQKARKIAPHAGIIKRNLRLFNELVKCDTENILKDVRKAIEGKE